MSSSARKKMARRSSSMASLARFITWNGSWTMATVLELRVALDRVLERLVHVHREEPQPLLLPALQGVEPELEGLLGASVADPDRLAGLQVADDGDELLGALVATTEVLLSRRRCPSSRGLGRWASQRAMAIDSARRTVDQLSPYCAATRMIGIEAACSARCCCRRRVSR
jgi:hypothetical protein